MARDYTSLITSHHQAAPNFVATVALLSSALGGTIDTLASVPVKFDVDVAVGDQLDAVGAWAGISRKLSLPISNAYFTWNGSATVGWNRGNWKGPNEASEGIVSLDDGTYRALIKAKIAANYWDGSNADLNSIASTVMAGVGGACYVVDNLDMTVTVYILGGPTAAATALIQRNITPPKTAGVGVTSYVFRPAPLFALDAPTTIATAGLDFGSFDGNL